MASHSQTPNLSVVAAALLHWDQPCASSKYGDIVNIQIQVVVMVATIKSHAPPYWVILPPHLFDVGGHHTSVSVQLYQRPCRLRHSSSQAIDTSGVGLSVSRDWTKSMRLKPIMAVASTIKVSEANNSCEANVHTGCKWSWVYPRPYAVFKCSQGSHSIRASVTKVAGHT